jgi:hypothetical protein
MDVKVGSDCSFVRDRHHGSFGIELN